MIIFSYKEKKYVDTRTYLAFVISEINEYGYIKYKTAENAFDLAKDATEYENIKDIDLNKATEIIQFFTDLDLDDSIVDNFVIDVRTAVISKYTKKSGFIAYAPILYEKLKKELKEKSDREKIKQISNYVGNIGDKISTEVTVINVFGIDTMYGYSYLNIFEEKDTHNILTWFTSTKAFEIGSRIKILGKIKEHKEYDGEKQTVLTRVKEIA